MRNIIALAFILLMTTSCTHAISSPIRAAAEKEGSFTSVKTNIDGNIGSTFIWGGIIANTVGSESGSYIEVIQSPLDKYGDIIDPDASYGRFLVSSPRFLDPLIFEKGRLITVAGILTKPVTGNIAGKPYVYPLIEALEIHLWKDVVEVTPIYLLPMPTTIISPWIIITPDATEEHPGKHPHKRKKDSPPLH